MATRKTLDMVMTIAARFGGKAVNLLVFVIVARHLSLPDLAIYGYIFSTTLILSTVLDLGVRNSVAVFLGRDPQGARSLAYQTFVLWLALGTLVVPATWLSLDWSGLDILSAAYFTPAAVLLAAMLYLRMLQGILLGEGKIALFNRTDLASRVALIVLTVAFLLTEGLTLIEALWGLALSQLVAALYLFACQRKDIWTGREGGLGSARALLARGFLFMLSVLLMNAAKRAAFFGVTHVVGPDSAGLFFTLQRLTEVITEVGMAVSVVMFSHNVRAKTTEDAVHSTAHSTRLSLFVFVLIGMGLSVTAPWLLPIALGGKFDGHTALFLIILVATVIGSVWTMLFPNLSVSTTPMTVFWLLLPGLLLNIVLLFPLIQVAGISGAALSMLISNIVITGMFVRAYRRRFGIPASHFLLVQPGDLGGMQKLLRKVRT